MNIPLQSKQQGLALVEASIVLPLIVLLFLGVAEFGRAFMQLTTLNKAQQNGARYLSANVFRGDSDVVVLDAANRQQSRNLVVYGNIAGTGTPVLQGLTPAQVNITANGGFVTLNTSYTYQPLSTYLIGSTFDMRSSITMRAVR